MGAFEDFQGAFGGGGGGGGGSVATSTVTPPPGSNAKADFMVAFGTGAPAKLPAPSAGAIAKDVAQQAGSALVEGPIMATFGAPGDIAEAGKAGGVFDKAYLGLEHRIQDWTGLGPQAGTPERAKFDSDYLGTRGNLDFTKVIPHTPTTPEILNAAGIQLPEPQTAPGRYTRMAGDFAAGAVTGNAPAIAARAVEGGVVPAVQAAGRTAAAGLAPGIGAQALTDAADATGNSDLAPIAQLVGGAAGHAIPHAAAAAGSGLIHSAPVAGALDKVGISGPVLTRAARQFIDTSTDPTAVRQALANPANPEGAPGTQFASIASPDANGTPIFAQPSTGELTQDPGLMIAQRGDMVRNTAAYLPQMAEGNQARIAFMQSDPGADPLAVSTHLRDSLNAIHDDANTKLDAARTDAQARLDAAQQASQAGVETAQAAGDARVQQTDAATQAALGDAEARQAEATRPIQSAPPETLGEALRQPLVDLNAAAKAREGALHEAIDPNNVLSVSTAPMGEAVRRAYGDLAQAEKGDLSPAEQKFVGLIGGYKPVESYKEAAALSSILAKDMRAERAVNQGITPAYRRMAIVMDGVKNALHDTVRETVDREARDVASGSLRPDATVTARLRDLWSADDGRGENASGAGLRTGTDAGDFPGDRPFGGASAGGAGPAEAGRRGPAPSDQGLSGAPGGAQDSAPRVTTPAQPGPRPQSLISFLQRAGGVRDQGGNLAAAGHDRYPGLITRNGLPLDRAREMAAEAGYLGADTTHAVSNTTVNDLLDAIGGHPTYSVRDENVVMDRAQRAAEVAHQKEFAGARSNVMDVMMRDHGFRKSDFDQRIVNQATNIAMEEGASPLDAYELAIKRSIDENEARRKAADDAALDAGWDKHLDEHWGESPRSRGNGERGAQAGDANAAGAGSRGASAGGAQSALGQQGARSAEPPASEEAAQRIRAASAATRERKATFERGAVGDVLRSGPVAGEYKISDARVPAKLFQPGPAGGDAVRSYFGAAGDHPQAVDAMHAAATNELAKIVEKNGGSLTEAGRRYWQRRHADALRAIDERTPGFSSRFNNADAATTEVERLTGARRDAMREAEDARDAAVKAATREGAASVREAQRAGAEAEKGVDRAGRQAAKDFQQGIVKNLLESKNPESVVAHMKTLIADAKTGAREADRIVAAVKDHPVAEAGLRNATARAFSEQIVGTEKILGNDTPMVKAGAGKALETAMPVLSRILSPEHLGLVRRAVADAERQETLLSGTKLPRGSNTGQDTAAAGAHGGAKALASHGAVSGFMVLAYEHGEHVFNLVPGWAQVAGGMALGSYAVRKTYTMLRNMGIKSTQRYFEEMLRNPEFAAQMVKRVSPTYDVRQQRITGLIRKSLMIRPPDEHDGGTGGAPPSEPPPGPFSPAGRPEAPVPAADDRGRVEPAMSASAPTNVEAKPDKPQPNVPLTGRQARTLRAAGYEPAEIGAMSSQERAAAVRQAEAAGFSPIGRITPADRAAMRGALPHVEFDGRSGDGRFAGRGDLLSHPDVNERVEPTWHPDADATHQAILAHEKRLATRLTPDSSVGDIRKTSDAAAGDVLAMTRKAPQDDNAAPGAMTQLAKTEAPRLTVDTQLGGKRRMTQAQVEREIGERERQADALRNAGQEQRAANIDAEIASLRTAAPSFKDYKPGDRAKPFQPSKIVDAGDRHVVSVATDERHGATPESKTFRIFDKPDGGASRRTDLGRQLGHVEINRGPDGRWEVQMVEVSSRARGQGVATALYGAVQKELGVEMSPSGILLPDGYSFWQKRAPEKVQFHQPFEHPSGERYYLSPKRIGLLAEQDHPNANEYRKSFDALPPEAKTQASLDAMFSLRQKGGEAPTSGQPSDLALTNVRTGVSAQAQSRMSFRDAMHANDVSANPRADSLARASSLAVGHRLSQLIGDMPVYTVGASEMRALAEGRVKMQSGFEPAGFFDPQSGHIAVLDDAMRDPAEASRLILHEGLHGALMHVINGSDSARNLIDHLRQTATTQHAERGGGAADHYGLTNAHEFVSEAFSNPEFQRFLSSIKADDRTVRAFGLQNTGKTMWDVFTAAVRKIMGLAPKDHTMLDAAMKLGGHLLDHAEATKAATPAPATPAGMPMPSIGAMQGNPTLSAMSRLLGG